MSQDRYITLFSIKYSIRLEKMTCTLSSRVDRWSTLIQLFLGAAVFAKSEYQQAIGVTVALLAMISFVWQPGVKAAQAKRLKNNYEALLAREQDLNDEQLYAEFTSIQSDDSDEIGALCNVAHVAEEIAAGQKPSLDLTLREKVVAWCAGDLPRKPKTITP